MLQRDLLLHYRSFTEKIPMFTDYRSHSAQYQLSSAYTIVRFAEKK